MIDEEISEKERERRRKISETKKRQIREKRERGYREYVKRLRREIRKRKTIERREKEKEKRKKEKEKERLKLLKKKRKVGRPKKTGPKPKYWKRYRPKPPKKKRGRRKKDYLYKIISCRNGTQNKYIGKFVSIEEAYEKFNELKEMDKNVIFPQMVASTDEKYEKSVNEYLLIGKCEDDDNETVLLRNEYGKLVEQNINIDGWKIIDKVQYKKEETFWVYGYNNVNDRKTFEWIYNNLLIGDIQSRYDIKRVLLYKNKVIFKSEDYMDIIICKNIFDSIRFYNELIKFVKKDKLKQIIFFGDYSELSERRSKLESEIMEFTGWSKKKTQMNVSKFR